MFAKAGAAVGLDAPNNRLSVGAITTAGCLDKGDGRFGVFFAGVNGVSSPTTDVNGVLDIADDLAMISAYPQEAAARREDRERCLAAGWGSRTPRASAPGVTGHGP
ncbi:hypothetical protein OG596_19745 [Streptomyces sp. NBC_01102]|uniref:hypothetical protein n=1 Tax=unclassified Streptomyces TaxID=2593676 RepID=UPI003869E7BA|nr:hypothetical protein OG596_19745 [Streptomyces sp. NBC_01102]